jgi:catechol 2,3-dioxygenase-like lactoylglutathione lyase family enzyme
MQADNAVRWRPVAVTPILPVTDLERSVSWFRDVMGFGVNFIEGSWASLSKDSFELLLHSVDQPPEPQWIYPDYPSGYNGFAAAVTRGLEQMFHTRRLQLTVTSTAVPDVRHYDSGRALRQDVVDGRMLLGIHFRFADTAARDMGVRLTDWALARYFQPLHRHR